jgi:hypothetical protein
MFKYLVSRALAKGSRRGLQGSQFWAVVATLAATVRVIEWLNRPTKRDVVWRQVISEGDRFEVVVRPRDKGRTA